MTDRSYGATTDALGTMGDAVGDAEFLGEFFDAANRFQRQMVRTREDEIHLADKAREEEEQFLTHQMSILGPALVKVAQIEGDECVNGRYQIKGIEGAPEDVFLESSGRLVALRYRLSDFKSYALVNLGLALAFGLLGYWVAAIWIAIWGLAISLSAASTNEGVVLDTLRILTAITALPAAAGGVLLASQHGGAWGAGVQALGVVSGAMLWGVSLDKMQHWVRRRFVAFDILDPTRGIVDILRKQFDGAAQKFGAF